MNSSDRIKDLQRQIQAEEQKIRNCRHEFGESFHNPETVTEAYGYRMTAQGSDVWGQPEGFRDVQKPRWTRRCNKCGFEQHTNKQEPVITGYKPSF